LSNRKGPLQKPKGTTASCSGWKGASTGLTKGTKEEQIRVPLKRSHSNDVFDPPTIGIQLKTGHGSA
jgi:hypothetical protein